MGHLALPAREREAWVDRQCPNANISEPSEYYVVYNANKIKYFVNHMEQIL